MNKDKMLETAFDNLDMDMLEKAVSLGADINCQDAGEALWCRLLFIQTNSGELPDFSKPEQRQKYEEYKAGFKKFYSYAIDCLGLDLNAHAVSNNGGEDDIGCMETVFRYCCYDDLDLVQFFIDKGADVNFTYESMRTTILDNMESDIETEYLAGCYSQEKWLDDVCRLLVRNGAKPYWLLHPQNNKGELESSYFARSLNAGRIAKMSGEKIAALSLDIEIVENSKYCYPCDFYESSASLQRRICDCLDIVIGKIGVESLDENMLFICAEQRYDLVLAHLFGKYAVSGNGCHDNGGGGCNGCSGNTDKAIRLLRDFVENQWYRMLPQCCKNIFGILAGYDASIADAWQRSSDLIGDYAEELRDSDKFDHVDIVDDSYFGGKMLWCVPAGKSERPEYIRPDYFGKSDSIARFRIVDWQLADCKLLSLPRANVVYNNCHGGFGLSEEAIRLYNEISGKSIGESDVLLLKRHDKSLVEVVRRLGKLANGRFASLSIAAICSDRYIISDFDGLEIVETELCKPKWTSIYEDSL